MYKASLKFVVLILALLYVIAGAASVAELRRGEEYLVAWTLLAGLCFFLAAGIWRLSRIARTTSVTLLWVVVLVGTVGALHPYYFPELTPAFDYPQLRGISEILLAPAFLAFVGIWILGKNKKEFR